MRARALIVVCGLLWAPLALADERSDFEKARVAYVKKDYVEADARFAAALDPKTGSIKTPALVEEAEFGWGATKWARGDKESAHALWEKVIRESNGTYQPDVLTYPAEVINDFIDEKKHLNDAIREQLQRDAERAAAQRKRDAEEKARLQARVKQLETLASQETVVVENSRLVALLPFGIGQFENRRTTLGLIFLGTETAAVLATVGYFIAYRYNIDQANSVWNDPTPVPLQQRITLYDQYAAVAQNLRTADFITLGALGAIAIAGIIQAEIDFKPRFSYVRKRQISVLPTVSPGFVGLTGQF